MFGNNIIIFTFFVIVEPANILMVFPIPSISHQVVFRPVIQELVNRDHEITLITTDPIYQQDKSPKNLKLINLHNLSYTLWDHLISNVVKIDDKTDFWSMLIIGYDVVTEMFEEQVKHKSVEELTRNKTVKFDLIITEECSTLASIFGYIFKAPVIQISSFGSHPGNLEVMGATTHPLFYPMHFQPKIYNFTMWEKIDMFYDLIWFDQMLKRQEMKDNIMLQRRFGNNVPLLSQLRNKVQMRFLNVHSIWTHNQPVPSTVVYTWGSSKRPAKPLPEDIQSYLDSSQTGAIYLSFGTNFRTSSIPPETLTILLKVLSRLPYNVLWKWDKDELPGKSENIKISKWFPQSDILRHPNLKLIITHGGLQSTDEAINAGVPLIGIPVFADQQYNTEKYVYFKIGTKLDFESLTVEYFEEAIKTVVTEYDRYKKNIIQLRTLMNDQPKPPLENTIWWIEYILRHGDAQHLRAFVANMSWIEYYEVKLVFFIFGGLIILVILLLTLVYFSFKFISRRYLEINKTKVL